jgi:phage terminase large subunit-like protein
MTSLCLCSQVSDNLRQLQEVIDQVSAGITGISINPQDEAISANAMKRLEDMLTQQVITLCHQHIMRYI